MNNPNINFPYAIMDENCIPCKEKNKSVFKECLKKLSEKGIKKSDYRICNTIIYDGFDLLFHDKNKIFVRLNNNFKKGCKEIYLIFDNYNNLKNNHIIKQKAYNKLNYGNKINKHKDINIFIDFLKNIKNKHINFNVKIIGIYINKTLTIFNNEYIFSENKNISNHIEADTDIWYNNNLILKNTLIIFMDMDLIMIALLIYNNFNIQNKNNILRVIGKNEIQDFYINEVVNDINNYFKDKIIINFPVQNVVVIYILSGCDYISHFYHVNKERFFNTYIKYFYYIKDLIYYKNKYIKMNTDSCLKLIGLSYFERYNETYKKEGIHFKNDIINMEGKKIVEYIRNIMIDNINVISCKKDYIKRIIPNYNSLLYHILRVEYVINIWNQSLEKKINYENPEKYGWKKKDDMFILKYE